MLEQQSLQVNDFSGGITDYPFDAPLNKAATLENLIIDPNRKALLRPGSTIYNEDLAQTPEGVARIQNITVVESDEIFYLVVGQKVFHPNALETAYVEVQAPGSNPAFNAGSITLGNTSFGEWNRHIYGVNDSFAKPIKIFKDGTNTPVVRTAGLPPLATDPVITPTVVGAQTFIYYFVRSYTYLVGTTQYLDQSSVVQVQVLNSSDPSVNQNNISAIAVLANAGGTAYDTANIKVEIYRTTNGGKVGFKVGEVTNGTTVFVDNFSDATIQANGITIYTAGGTLDYDEPPLAKFIHVMNGRAYYMNLKEGSEFLPSRIRQSVTDDPDACPVDFFLDVRDTITGGSSYNSNLIVFGQTKVFRIDGYFDELGRDGMTYEEISKVTGCLSHRSIVQTRDGVFFFGNDGVYFTDGFQVNKISDSINERYKTYITDPAFYTRIEGKYDALNSKIYWTVRADEASDDNDTLLVLDLRYGVRLDSTFTTWTNGESFAPSAINLYNDELLRADFRGFLFRHDPDVATDPKVDILALPEDWTKLAIIWDYKSVAFNFGMPMVRKWVSQLLVTLKNISNVSVQAYSINDDSSVEDPLKEIRFRDTCVWGQEDIIWGTDTIQWAFFGLIEQRRRFPAGGLRCSYKQIRLTNAYTNIINSDSITTASLDRVTKILTLDDPLFSWPLDIEDYDIGLGGNIDPPLYDEARFPIVERLSDTQIQLLDPTNRVNTVFNTIDFDVNQWIIQGKPKNEIVQLMSYIIYFSPLTPNTFRTYKGGKAETGEP